MNQAEWGLIGNLQGGQAGPGQGPGGAPGNEHGGFPTPTSFPATVATGPGGPNHATTVANSGAPGPGNGSAGFLGWGASPGGEAVPGAPQQTTPLSLLVSCLNFSSFHILRFKPILCSINIYDCHQFKEQYFSSSILKA